MTRFLVMTLLVAAACSTAPKKKAPATPPPPPPAGAPCATISEINERLGDLPELLVRLGGEHKAVRSYKSRPTDFFKEGHSTACRSVKDCPQTFSLKLHLPSTPQSKSEPKTFHIGLKLLGRAEPATFDFHIDDVASSGDEPEYMEATGQHEEQRFYARAVGKDHIYVEWVQRDNNSPANQEPYVLIRLLPSTAEQLRTHVSIQGKGVCPGAT
ncbi:MAG TPA: hypothetical protein VFV50_12065 [Bdellovibrionales bacterium]|nr:hypothetical protein [Bdellovibrionales bacterium]